VIVSIERMRDNVSLSDNIINLLTSISVTYTCKIIFTSKYAFRRYQNAFYMLLLTKHLSLSEKVLVFSVSGNVFHV
jgi:hypothetical protein